MKQSRHVTLVAFLILTSSVVGQPPLKPNSDGKVSLSTKPVATFRDHAAEVTALAFDRDGKRIISVSSQDVRQWEAASGKEIARFHSVGEGVVTIRPDRPTLAVVELATGRVENVVLREAVEGKQLLTIIPHDEREKESSMRGGFIGSACRSDGLQP